MHPLNLHSSFAIAGIDSSTTSLAPSKFQCQLRVHDNLTSDLCDGTVDFPTLFNAIGSRNTAAEQFGDSPNAVNMLFRWSSYIRMPFKLLLAILLKKEKFFARHLPE